MRLLHIAFYKLLSETSCFLHVAFYKFSSKNRLLQIFCNSNKSIVSGNKSNVKSNKSTVAIYKSTVAFYKYLVAFHKLPSTNRRWRRPLICISSFLSFVYYSLTFRIHSILFNRLTRLHYYHCLRAAVSCY